MSTNEKVAEQLKTMSLKELRDALDFHFTHMKLIHQEVDARITKMQEKVDQAEQFLKDTE